MGWYGSVKQLGNSKKIICTVNVGKLCFNFHYSWLVVSTSVKKKVNQCQTHDSTRALIKRPANKTFEGPPPISALFLSPFTVIRSLHSSLKKSEKRPAPSHPKLIICPPRHMGTHMGVSINGSPKGWFGLYSNGKSYWNGWHLGVPAFIWVNYHISLTWIKAIWGWFPLLTMISSEVVVRSL